MTYMSPAVGTKYTMSNKTKIPKDGAYKNY